MKFTLSLTIGLALAASMPDALAIGCLPQSESDAPTFRPRTDANATRDLQLLRDALNQASDSAGAINPLGKFLQRNAETPSSEQPNPKSQKTEPGVDIEAEQKPRLELRDAKDSDRFAAPKSNPKTKESSSIGVLPGPHYFIVQQASPRYSDRITDNFLPAPQYPVSLASASIPVADSSSVVRANFQELPGTGAYQGSAVMPNGIPGVFPNAMSGNIPIQAPASMDGSSQPMLPYTPPLPVNPGNVPVNPGVFPGGTIPQNNPAINNPGIVNPVPGYANPGIANPVNPSQTYQPQPYYPQQPNAPLRSASDSLPSYPQPTTHGPWTSICKRSTMPVRCSIHGLAKCISPISRLLPPQPEVAGQDMQHSPVVLRLPTLLRPTCHTTTMGTIQDFVHSSALDRP